MANLRAPSRAWGLCLKGAPGQLKSGTVVQILGCARGEGTTYSAIKEFAKQPICTVFMLQEPWSEKNKPPLDHPDFTIFSPSTKNPKCATYIRISACLQPYIHFQCRNFAIAIAIQSIDHYLPLTIYNVYSPGRQIHAANVLPEHIPNPPAIFMGDLNAHHQWWYGSEATNTTQQGNTSKEV
jgi:hypothetical protein